MIENIKVKHKIYGGEVELSDWEENQLVDIAGERWKLKNVVILNEIS